MKKIFRLISIISIISFILHLIWEYAQCAPFFNHLNLKPTRQSMLIATLGDVNLTYIAFFVISTVKRDWLWVMEPWDKKVFLSMFTIALVLSIGIEFRALSTERWSYSSSNPLLFDYISIIPILQLLILFPLSFYLSRLVITLLKNKD
ncbi:MAG: hypothetical protein CME70_11345 [Halobacteriovorax sp.]|nr:hypothetical protein [Halobacteriovorax sp.]|tara:strand:- start:85464 stop:85907 length:444 start_codon:yes stop_codon:yes gene_type:complete